MRLARRALVAALTTLMLSAAVSAQTLRQENDPRNTAPTVGTGGSPGGPTGLFTIYDGSTLRKGEFTFSFAYSNYDRDPGNVDIVETPVSFQIGLSDYLELFYNTDAYRGIKVNNPRNLSSFYLPNSQLRFSATQLGSGAAIVLTPNRVSGPTIPTGALFRPAFNQPFVQFPFVGGPSGNFGLSGNRFAPPFVGRLGVSGGGDSNFGAAANFPGIGSVFGSILPGVVLSTTTGTPTGGIPGGTVVPDTRTLAPSYLPDAPFINRLYGESSFNTHTVGAKIRFTGPDNPFGIGIVPFYRFYLDKGDDFSGFNQLQRGASPGGDIGDFGAIMFFDGRLSRSVNLSANIGYILNSNPKGTFGSTEAVMLDRPDEFIAGIGFDFPVNEHFQPIAELRSTRYVGGRTPNAFQNNPVDALFGVRLYPRRFMGFSVAYRNHINQQGDRALDFFGDDPSFPRGFTQSDDPHGFLAQFFIGRRNERAPAILPNQPPTVTLTASSQRVVLAAECAGDQIADTTCTPTSQQVQLSAQATDPDGDTLLYTYSTTGGRITGDGPNATLDLTGVQPGTYNVTVEVDDGCGCIAFTTTTVTVERCNCVTPPPPPCPTVRVTCQDSVQVGSPITFSADVSGGDPNVTPTYNWSVSAGTISSGQGTSSITVDTTGLSGQTVTATVDVGGYPASCSGTSTCSTQVIGAPPVGRKVDEYGNVNFNDEKARLDNFAIALQNEPGAQGYIIAYGGRRGRSGAAQARADRARDYLVNQRGIDAGRIQTLDGGFREDLTVELYIVPQGATAPSASPTIDPSEVQTTTPRRRRSPRRRRGDE